MIQCIAIDDEPLALQIIEDFCSRVPYLDLQNTFTRTSEAEKHLNNASVDLLFLDIQMPDILGIDFYKGISTVSYTHRDGYKRQFYYLALC